MVSLQQLYSAVEKMKTVDGETHYVLENIESAIVSLKEAIDNMNELSVRGRDSVDTLLGCMLAVEAIIGEDSNGK